MAAAGRSGFDADLKETPDPCRMRATFGRPEARAATAFWNGRPERAPYTGPALFFTATLDR
ncbi:MAG: hypothetical protein NVSMB47_05450 [Polyangiales bacterium]